MNEAAGGGARESLAQTQLTRTRVCRVGRGATRTYKEHAEFECQELLGCGEDADGKYIRVVCARRTSTPYRYMSPTQRLSDAEQSK